MRKMFFFLILSFLCIRPSLSEDQSFVVKNESSYPISLTWAEFLGTEVHQENLIISFAKGLFYGFLVYPFKALDLKTGDCELLNAKEKKGEKALYVQIDRRGVFKDETMVVLVLKKGHKNYKGNFFIVKDSPWTEKERMEDFNKKLVDVEYFYAKKPSCDPGTEIEKR